MNSQSTEHLDARVVRCLQRHCNVITVDSETKLSALEMDSLDFIECLFELENIYGRTLSNNELASLRTVHDLVNTFHSSKEG